MTDVSLPAESDKPREATRRWFLKEESMTVGGRRAETDGSRPFLLLVMPSSPQLIANHMDVICEAGDGSLSRQKRPLCQSKCDEPVSMCLAVAVCRDMPSFRS